MSRSPKPPFSAKVLPFALAFEHAQGAANDEQQNIGDHDRIVVIKPERIFFALFERVLGRFADQIVFEGSVSIQAQLSRNVVRPRP